MLDLAAAFIALTTFFSFLNYRFVHLPPTIGVMISAMVLSLVVHGVAALGYPVLEDEVQELIRQIDFSDVLMTWFLPALLFAGALHVNLDDLRSYRWHIGLLATAGVLLSTFVAAGLAYSIFQAFGWHVHFIYCLLFGALISPTDPIAVMGILKSSGAPKPLQTTIVGESLFNDGTAVVLFSILLGVLTLGEVPTAEEVGVLFLKEAVGGVVFGLVLGFAGFFLMRQVDEHQPTIMLTLALVLGGSALATHLHVSAPIVMVVAGLVIGNQGRRKAMSDHTRRYVDGFWEVIDEILNALLFALIGLELLVLPLGWLQFLAALALGLAVLLSRFVTVAAIINMLRRIRGRDRRTGAGVVRILTWGGLRGGVSVALALSLPLGEERDLLLSLTYIVVLVSILAQGLSIGRVVRAFYGSEPKQEESTH